MLVSTAEVATDAAARYAKQLLAHLGRKNPVDALEGVPDGGVLRFAYGRGTVRPEGERLVLEAAAADVESLAHVQDVLARHLERFAARRELAVRWSPQESPVRTIHTDDAPSHAGPVPQAVEAGGWVHVSALFGVTPRDRAIPEDARAEAGQLFDNLAAILAAAGCTLTDVVRVGVVMTDLQRDRSAFNEVWVERFGEHRPARSAIESTAFGRPGEHARFMIEVAAYRG